MKTIFRIFPRTYIAFKRALNKLHRRIENTSPDKNPLSKSVLDREKENYPLFESAYTDYMQYLALQIKASNEEDEAQAKTFKLISQFIQVFDFGIKRGIFKAADRRYYGLPADSSALPSLGREEDVIGWANNLIKGEKLRVEAGGTAMINPAIEKISDAMAEFLETSNVQMMAKQEFITKQLILAKMIPTLDQLIRDAWDELNFFYRKEEPAAKRRILRTWGVVYSIDRTPNAEVPPVVVKVKIPVGENLCVEEFTADFKKNDSFTIHNTGNTSLEFYTSYLPDDVVPGSTVKIEAEEKTTVAVDELGSVHNLYFKVHNANKSLAGKCDITVNHYGINQEEIK